MNAKESKELCSWTPQKTFGGVCGPHQQSKSDVRMCPVSSLSFGFVCRPVPLTPLCVTDTVLHQSQNTSTFRHAHSHYYQKNLTTATWRTDKNVKCKISNTLATDDLNLSIHHYVLRLIYYDIKGIVRIDDLYSSVIIYSLVANQETYNEILSRMSELPQSKFNTIKVIHMTCMSIFHVFWKSFMWGKYRKVIVYFKFRAFDASLTWNLVTRQ